jgi:hypothetical protein
LDLRFFTSTTPGAAVHESRPGCWRLVIPSGGKGRYRLAQLDDYRSLSRDRFPWYAPLRLRLRARVSEPHIAGTWGFGLWNDPFSLSLGLGGGTRRFPALPNAAWFFFAAPPNFLSFRDDAVGQGFLMQVFRAGRVSPLLLAGAGLGLPLLGWARLARGMRPWLRRWIEDDSLGLSLAVCKWHDYEVHWQPEGVAFWVDGERVFSTNLVPQGPLGMVVWIDNQYAAYTPDGRVAYGKLKTVQPAWLEVEGVQMTPA